MTETDVYLLKPEALDAVFSAPCDEGHTLRWGNANGLPFELLYKKPEAQSDESLTQQLRDLGEIVGEAYQKALLDLA